MIVLAKFDFIEGYPYIIDNGVKHFLMVYDFLVDYGGNKIVDHEGNFIIAIPNI